MIAQVFQAPSLRARLSRQFALQTIVGLSLVCGVVYLVIALTLAGRQDDTLVKKRAAVQRLLAEGEELHDVPAIKHLLSDFLAGHDDLSLVVRQRDGLAVFDKNDPTRPEDMSKRLTFEVKLPVELGGAGTAEFIYDIRKDESLLSRLWWTLLTAAIVGTFAVSATGFLLVKRGLAPLNALARRTSELDASRLDLRLDGAGQPEEVQPLLMQLNALLDRLQAAYAQMEAFNADVAHELNNPLSILIGSCEVALRRPRSQAELHDTLTSNLEELRRVAGIVADMLFLSHAERGVEARRTLPMSLADLAAEVIEYHEAALEEAELRVEVLGDARVAVDVGLVRRALSNLLSNATRYAVKGSQIEVRIDRLESSIVSIGVHNQGEVIPPQHLPRLFDRFYRIDPSRTNANRNHGLGLAIVAAIAKMHGGTVAAESDQTGTFIRFTLMTGSGAAKTGEPERMAVRVRDEGNGAC
ncbi:MAG: heavy metal sensor histidine kinase [Roseateles sp.]|uniref:Sensor protein n=1 Tax=Roseateles asaccharophilus TaxID=582607 RepID=A0ABU2AHS9_9BURK|nr:heavy metal sensor histidine kinase [Roseateles asaccharophilus]MDR7336193.1 two-component system heavy metal sensor histidine kinase CusS [Roseateles asaccharophilus]